MTERRPDLSLHLSQMPPLAGTGRRNPHEWGKMKDKEAEEALFTISATTGLSVEKALEVAVIGYATILQGREGLIASVNRIEGGKRTSVVRMLFISELYESEMALRALRIAMACGLALTAIGSYFGQAVQDHAWWHVALGAVGAAAIGYVAYDSLTGVVPRSDG